jgi:hypothetical protein
MKFIGFIYNLILNLSEWTPNEHHKKLSELKKWKTHISELKMASQVSDMIQNVFSMILDSVSLVISVGNNITKVFVLL